MFVKLKPEEYFVSKSLLGDSEDPATSWYNGAALYPNDYDQYENWTIIAYATTASDVKLLREYKEKLEEITTCKIDDILGLPIAPYSIVLGLGYSNNPNTEAKRMFREAMKEKEDD